jgi:uncharacterized protein DUF5658
MADVERRQLPDRRKRPTPLLSRYCISGRRRGARRRDEARNSYVDRYDVPMAAAALLIVLLSILDAYYTLNYLSRGGRELNPVAQSFIDFGPRTFVIMKGIVTGSCVLFLIVHKNFSVVRHVLTVVLSFYTLLLCYHLYLHAL